MFQRDALAEYWVNPDRLKRKKKHPKADEEALREAIIKLAKDYGRYGYRRITALLNNDRWKVNHKRVERIWSKEGLKVPQKQPKRKRLWLNDGSCIRLKPLYKNHVWSYDFLFERTSDGRSMKILSILDEYLGGMFISAHRKKDELIGATLQAFRVVCSTWSTGLHKI